MKSKSNKNNHQKLKNRENGTRDFVIANRMSGKVHGGLSRIRLSLTFRIALHYCIQMLRSFIAVAIILTIMMCLFISYPVSRELRSMIPSEKDENQTEINTGYLKAELLFNLGSSSVFFSSAGSFNVEGGRMDLGASSFSSVSALAAAAAIAAAVAGLV